MITSLAPMESVTDSVFRQIIIKCGRPDLFFTEFTNVSGLFSKGSLSVLQNLKYSQIEKPLIAQIWGNDVTKYPDAIKLCIDMGFDGIDINMGCPVPKVIKSGNGGYMITQRDLVSKIIDTSQNTLSKYNNIPLSIKTRIGYNEIDLSWIEFLLSKNLDTLTIHTRTVKELSKVPARWELFKEIIPMRNSMSPKTKIFGNGDIKTREQIETYGDIYGVDGIMVGRGIFTNPWIFNPNIKEKDITNEMRINILKEHVRLFKETWGGTKNLEILKKYFKIYLKGDTALLQLKNRLMELHSYEDMEKEIGI